MSGTCPEIPNTSSFDRYILRLERASRWRISSCEASSFDTILALYPEGEFDPAAPCSRRLALDDDACGPWSQIEIELSPGIYELIVIEKTGDDGGDYSLLVEEWTSEAGACPLAPAPIPTETSQPTATDLPSPTPSDPLASPTPASTLVNPETGTPDPGDPGAPGQPGDGTPTSEATAQPSHTPTIPPATQALAPKDTP